MWIAALALFALPQGTPTLPSAPDDAASLSRWMTAIEPDEVERGFEAIGWRNDLRAAMTEAEELGRPILLWTMNGHPLGCT